MTYIRKIICFFNILAWHSGIRIFMYSIHGNDNGIGNNTNHYTATYSLSLVDICVCFLRMQEFKVMTHDKHFCLYTLNRNCSCLLLLLLIFRSMHWCDAVLSLTWLRFCFLFHFIRVINSLAHGQIRANLFEHSVIGVYHIRR